LLTVGNGRQFSTKAHLRRRTYAKAQTWKK
jgi:hypothetical protein